MNGDRLRELYVSDGDFRVIMDHFASRIRNRTSTPVRVICERINREDDIPVSPDEVRAVFRQLEEAGCGRFILGRRGYESRFFWDVELIGAAQVARGEAEIAQVIPEAPESDEPDTDLISYSLRLRRNLDVEFELPGDLTVTEADRLAYYIKSLPLEES